MTQMRRGAGTAAIELVHGGDVGDVRVAVKAGDLDPAVAQPFAHVETHFSKADQSDVHGMNSFLRWGTSGGSSPNWLALVVVLRGQNDDVLRASWGAGPA